MTNVATSNGPGLFDPLVLSVLQHPGSAAWRLPLLVPVAMPSTLAVPTAAWLVGLRSPVFVSGSPDAIRLEFADGAAGAASESCVDHVDACCVSLQRRLRLSSAVNAWPPGVVALEGDRSWQRGDRSECWRTGSNSGPSRCDQSLIISPHESHRISSATPVYRNPARASRSNEYRQLTAGQLTYVDSLFRCSIEFTQTLSRVYRRSFWTA